MQAKKIELPAEWIKNDDEWLPRILPLMMSVDAMRSASRWMQLLEGKQRPEHKTDILMSVIAQSGWAAVTLGVLQRGISEDWVQRKMVEDVPQLAELWEECFAKPKGEFITMIWRIRDKYFAHRDVDTVRDAVSKIKTLSANGEAVFAVETSRNGEYLMTRYPIAATAFSSELFDLPFDEEATRERLREFGRYLGSISNLANQVLQKTMKMAGWHRFARND